MELEQTQQQLDQAADRLRNFQYKLREKTGLSDDLIRDIYDSAGVELETPAFGYLATRGSNYSEPEQLGDSDPLNFLYFQRGYPRSTPRFPKTIALSFDAATNFEDLVRVIIEWDGSKNEVLWERFDMPKNGNWQLTQITRPGVLFAGPDSVAEKTALDPQNPTDTILGAMAMLTDYFWDDPAIYRFRASQIEPAQQYLDMEFIRKEGVLTGWSATRGLVNGKLLRAEYGNGNLTDYRGDLIQPIVDEPAFVYRRQAYPIDLTFDPSSILENIGRIKL